MARARVRGGLSGVLETGIGTEWWSPQESDLASRVGWKGGKGGASRRGWTLELAADGESCSSPGLFALPSLPKWT